MDEDRLSRLCETRQPLVPPTRRTAQRKRAAGERKKSFGYRQSLRDVAKGIPQDPVSKVDTAMAPEPPRKESLSPSDSGPGTRGTATNQGPTGRTAVGPSPFNLSKLKSKLNTIDEVERKNKHLEAMQNHRLTMDRIREGYLKDHKREVNQKHNANRKTKPDTPTKVKVLCQPFSKNREKYSQRNGTKTTAHKHVSKQDNNF